MTEILRQSQKETPGTHSLPEPRPEIACTGESDKKGNCHHATCT